MKYYHITDPSNIKSILNKGLVADEDGNIYLFKNESVLSLSIGIDKNGKNGYGYVETSIAELIAMNQVFLPTYAMFEVDVDETLLKKDNVAESTTRYQYILHQPRIELNKISLIGTYNVKLNKPLVKKLADLG